MRILILCYVIVQKCDIRNVYVANEELGASCQKVVRRVCIMSLAVSSGMSDALVGGIHKRQGTLHILAQAQT
jgi:hypothetical protein